MLGGVAGPEIPVLGRQKQEGELKSAYKRPCLTSAPMHACMCVYTHIQEHNRET